MRLTEKVLGMAPACTTPSPRRRIHSTLQLYLLKNTEELKCPFTPGYQNTPFPGPHFPATELCNGAAEADPVTV